MHGRNRTNKQTRARSGQTTWKGCREEAGRNICIVEGMGENRTSARRKTEQGIKGNKKQKRQEAKGEREESDGKRERQ